VGELLPLTIVTAAVSFDLVIRYASRHQRKLWASFAIPIFLIWPILSDAFYLSEKTELSGFSMRLEELSSSLTPDSVLFIHESYFPSVLTTLPLRLKHEVKTFRFKLTSTFSKSDLRETMNSFRAKGHEVYLTTTQQTFKHTQNLKFEKKIVLPYRKFEESHFDTPKQFTKRFFSLYLYKYTLEPIEISRSSS
jgi:hypothetical protein